MRRSLSVMDSVPAAMWGYCVETKLSRRNSVLGFKLLMSNAFAPSSSYSASRALLSNSYANVTISRSPYFIRLSPIFRWAVLQPNLSCKCSAIVFQLAFTPYFPLLPIAPALSKLVYNSGFMVILATLRTDVGPSSLGTNDVCENTQSPTADSHALYDSYLALPSSGVTNRPTVLIIACWKSDPSSHFPSGSYLASLLIRVLAGDGYVGGGGVVWNSDYNSRGMKVSGAITSGG